MKAKNIIRSVLIAQLILLVPLVAMQFSDEWDWNLGDFIIVGILLAGVGVAYQMVISGWKNNSRQVVIGALIAVTMVLLWIELAVGIFGSPIAGS